MINTTPRVVYCKRPRPGFARRGFSMVEVIIATATLGLVAVGVMQATVALDRASQATQQHDFASRELENSMQKLLLTPWDDLDTEAANWKLPEEVTNELPGVTLDASVMDQSEPAAKRVTLKLHLDASPKPLVLTAWVFADEEPTQ